MWICVCMWPSFTLSSITQTSPLQNPFTIPIRFSITHEASVGMTKTSEKDTTFNYTLKGKVISFSLIARVFLRRSSVLYSLSIHAFELKSKWCELFPVNYRKRYEKFNRKFYIKKMQRKRVHRCSKLEKKVFLRSLSWKLLQKRNRLSKKGA